MPARDDDQAISDWMAEHPELGAILEALASYRQGLEIDARCPTCQSVLTVTDFASIGSCWVTCERQCTSCHVRYLPSREVASK